MPGYFVLPVTDKRKSRALRFASQFRLEGRKEVPVKEKSTTLFEHEWTEECSSLKVEFFSAEADNIVRGLKSLGLKIINPKVSPRNLFSLKAGLLGPMEGWADILYCTDEDVHKEGKLHIHATPDPKSDYSETDFQTGSIVVIEGMYYSTEPVGINFAISSFEVSPL